MVQKTESQDTGSCITLSHGLALGLVTVQHLEVNNITVGRPLRPDERHR